MPQNFSTIHLSKNWPKFGNAIKISAEFWSALKNRPNWKKSAITCLSPLTTFTHENLKLHYFYFFFFDFCLTLFSKDIENGNLNKKEITGKFIFTLTISCEQD